MQLLKVIACALKEFKPEVTVASSGSAYIKFTGSKVREIRISNHTGHKLKRNVWQVRSDVMTTRGKNKSANNRIYNHKNVSQLIKDFK